MSEPNEWTEEQREALERWSGKETSDRHPHDLLPGGRKSEGGQDSETEATKNSPNDVQPNQCAEMRAMFKENEELTIKEMAENDFEFHRSTIAEHVFGRRCNHDIEEKSAESPMGNIDSGEFIQVEECAEMRKFWKKSREIVEVQDEFDKTYGQTYHHLAGRCKCEHGVPDIRKMQETEDG